VKVASEVPASSKCRLGNVSVKKELAGNLLPVFMVFYLLKNAKSFSHDKAETGSRGRRYRLNRYLSLPPLG
jgi:hypothetical protein